MTILVTGASGFIGSLLCEELLRLGHVVRGVSRSSKNLSSRYECVQWDAEKEEFPADRLKGVEAIVHLAGRNVAEKRWSRKFKDSLWHSRVSGTQKLVKALNETKEIKTLISISAIGYYGDRGDEGLDEDSKKGVGFLSDLCWHWENAARQFEGRTVILRLGVVLDSAGGALAKMLWPFRLGLGGRLGHGRQWMSWIHRRDLVDLILWSLNQPQAQGIYNVVALEPISNRELTQKLANHFRHRPFLPVPSGPLKWLLGEFAVEGPLASQRVRSKRWPVQEVKLRYQTFDDVLKDINSSTRPRS